MNHSTVLLQSKFFSSLKKASMTSNAVTKGQNNRHRIKDTLAYGDELQRVLKDSDWGF